MYHFRNTHSLSHLQNLRRKSYIVFLNILLLPSHSNKNKKLCLPLLEKNESILIKFCITCDYSSVFSFLLLSLNISSCVKAINFHVFVNLTLMMNSISEYSTSHGRHVYLKQMNFTLFEVQTPFWRSNVTVWSK